jgi:hypothetical protein
MLLFLTKNANLTYQWESGHQRQIICAKKWLSHETASLFILGRKEELMTRDGTVSDRAQLLKDEMETINREQEKLISRDKEVRRSSQ